MVLRFHDPGIILLQFQAILNFSVISNCIQLLVQDLENSCEVALYAMSKVNELNLKLKKNFNLKYDLRFHGKIYQ